MDGMLLYPVTTWFQPDDTPRGGDWLAQPRRRTHVAGMSETLLDVKGMNCPLPVLRANRALRGMAPGQRLRVLATDRAAVGDFQSFCQETGHALLAWSEESGIFSFVIRRRTEDRRPDDAIRDEAAIDAPKSAASSRRDRDRKDG